MNRLSPSGTAKKLSDFALWAKLAYPKLIVNIAVYADESGIHDLNAKQHGSKIAVLSGYAGFVDDWIAFVDRWQVVLDKYRVKFFHFQDYANKRLCAKKESFYFGWDEKSRHDFLFELAPIAGDRVRFPLAASFNLELFHLDPAIKYALKKVGLTDKQINGKYLVYMALFHEFFDLFIQELKAWRPNFKEDISFVFDRNDSNALWMIAANEAFNLFAKKDSRFRGIGFDDKKKIVPLQAADMIAYRMRQIRDNMEKYEEDHVFKDLDYKLWGGFEGYKDAREYFSKFQGFEHFKPKK